MEILIIGGALVALMAYVSTRIKKSAALAFAEETIETERFTLVKPEGFLSPVREIADPAFEAYSQDFGTGEESEKIRQAQISLRIFDDADFAEAGQKARQSVDSILSEETDRETGGVKILTLKGEKIENGVESEVWHKIIGKPGEVFDLRVSVLAENAEVYAEKIDRLIESFRVK